MDELFQALLQAKNQQLEELQAMPMASGDDVKSMLVGALAGAAGLPVDLMTTAMRPFGYDVPPAQVYGSSDWMGERMGADTDSGAFLAGQFISPDPLDAVKAANGLDNLIGAMTVFHGSPHKWDRVDLSKVGTGEGAQAYGHGFYAAENQGVASGYAKRLSKQGKNTSLTDDMNDLTVGGDRLLDKYDIESWPEFHRMVTEENMPEAARIGRERLERWKEYSVDPEYPFREYAADKVDAWSRLIPEVESGAVSNSAKGNLYELDIPDEAIDKMLDWDKPLSEQPYILNRIRQSRFADHLRILYGNDGINYEDMTGEEIYRIGLAEGVDEFELSDDPFRGASKALNSIGIPGIKYLDGTSRAAGEGTRNFVVFDEDLVKVLKRNNEPIK